MATHQDGSRLPQNHQNAADWISPVIFVTSLYLTQTPDGISLALGIVGNYLTDFFRGTSREKTVKIKLILEDTGERKFSQFEYEGEIDGLKDFATTVDKAISKWQRQKK